MATPRVHRCHSDVDLDKALPPYVAPMRGAKRRRQEGLIGWHDKFASAYPAFLDSCRLPPGRRRRSRWGARNSARTNGLEVRRRVGHTRRRGKAAGPYHLMCRVSAGWPGPGRRLRYARPGPRFSRVRGSGSSQDFGQRQREVCLRATRLGTWPGSADMGLARLWYPCPGLGEGGMQVAPRPRERPLPERRAAGPAVARPLHPPGPPDSRPARPPGPCRRRSLPARASSRARSAAGRRRMSGAESGRTVRGRPGRRSRPHSAAGLPAPAPRRAVCPPPPTPRRLPEPDRSWRSGGCVRAAAAWRAACR